MRTPPQYDWLTATEAATYLKVKRRSLLLWVRQGKVKGYDLAGTKQKVWRFLREDLDSTLLAQPVVSSLPPTVLTERKVM